jgi:hypothetical protein
MEDHEVSVTEILEREGWRGPVPPPARSRVRVLAVMTAVVLGCGAAALVVFLRPATEHRANAPEETGVIQVPRQTSPAPGGGTVLPDMPDNTGGTGAPVTEASTSEPPATTVSSTTRNARPRTERTGSGGAVTRTPPPGEHPSATPSPPPPPASVSAAPSTTKTCHWWDVLWC